MRPKLINLLGTYLKHTDGASNLWIGRIQVQREAVVHVTASRRNAAKAIHRELLVRVVLLKDPHRRADRVLILSVIDAIV